MAQLFLYLMLGAAFTLGILLVAELLGAGLVALLSWNRRRLSTFPPSWRASLEELNNRRSL